jgi:hypothetical protein
MGRHLLDKEIGKKKENRELYTSSCYRLLLLTIQDINCIKLVLGGTGFIKD